MKINIKALLSYIVMVGISVLFMLFLDGPGGSYLVLALIAAFIVSLCVFLWTKNTVCAQIKMSEDILNKGDIVRITLELKKKGFFPTSFIRFSFSSSIHFLSEGNMDFSTILFAQENHKTEKDFSALFFGNGSAGIKDMIISDYLGIFSCPVNDNSLYRVIKIYPDIPEISGRDSFARSLTDAVSFDDSEETSQSMVSINGTPGYDHRKYVPGDNLKLINWKISAKRGELLVRQLEGTGGAEQVFILIRDDLYFEESQFAAEAMLGMTSIFARAELPVRIVIYIGDEWCEYSVTNPSELAQLRYRMTDYYIFPLKKYCEENRISSAPELRKNVFPESVDGDRAVVFAPVNDENLSMFLDRLSVLGKEWEAAVCAGEVTGNRIRKIEHDNLSVRFSD